MNGRYKTVDTGLYGCQCSFWPGLFFPSQNLSPDCFLLKGLGILPGKRGLCGRAGEARGERAEEP